MSTATARGLARRTAQHTLVVLAALPLMLHGAVQALGAQPPTIGPAGGFEGVAERLDRFIQREMRDKGIPALSIALVDGAETVWAAGFGVERQATGRAADANTVYRVGSVSKLFTDLAVMQLAERGVLDLDAPVRRYVGAFAPRNPFGGTITLRQLMSHFSGLVREPPVGHYFDDSAPTLAATVASLNATALVHPPGASRKYSNAGIAVVGYALETVQREPFAQYLQRTVLRPMGLRSSAFTPEPGLVARLATGQMWTVHGRTFDAPTFELGMAPAGSMYSTMPDLARFLTVLFAGGRAADGEVVRSSTLDAMWRPQFAPAGARRGAGIGFAIGELEGRRTVGHGGAIYGFATQLTAMPDERLGVAVSAARDGMNALTERIANEALRLLLARREGRALRPIDTTRTLTLAEASSWGGRYRSARDGAQATFVVRDSAVTLQLPGVDQALLLRGWHGDTLMADDGLSYGTKVWRRGDVLLVDGTPFRRLGASEALPARPPAVVRGLVGEYGWDHNVLYIVERA